MGHIFGVRYSGGRGKPSPLRERSKCDFCEGLRDEGPASLDACAADWRGGGAVYLFLARDLDADAVGRGGDDCFWPGVLVRGAYAVGDFVFGYGAGAAFSDARALFADSESDLYFWDDWARWSFFVFAFAGFVFGVSGSDSDADFSGEE